jgi:hypothetical protein
MYVGEKSACVILVRKLDRKRSLGRSGRKWKNNINIDLQEVGWIDLAHNGDK